MIQYQGYYVMVCIMWSCMHVKTAKRPCQSTNSTHMINIHPKIIFQQKATKEDWFFKPIQFGRRISLFNGV